jgi:hypothetical protein
VCLVGQFYGRRQFKNSRKGARADGTDSNGKHGLDIQCLASQLGFSYEHTRKVVRGLAVHAPRLRSEMAEVLGLNIEELDKLAMEAKRREDHEVIQARNKRTDPRLETLKRLWEGLIVDRREDVLAIAKMWTREKEGERKRVNPRTTDSPPVLSPPIDSSRCERRERVQNAEKGGHRAAPATEALGGGSRVRVQALQSRPHTRTIYVWVAQVQGAFQALEAQGGKYPLDLRQDRQQFIRKAGPPLHGTSDAVRRIAHR